MNPLKPILKLFDETVLRKALYIVAIAGIAGVLSGCSHAQDITVETEKSGIIDDDTPTEFSNYERTDDPTAERSYEEYGDKDCSDFSTQDEAQSFFEEQGGPDEDYHNLDRDGDSIACETLP